jgi:phage-related protein
VGKRLYFVGSALDDLRAFPRAPRREAGYQLDRVQSGLQPSDWKSMTTVGRGVREIRIHHEGQYRVTYLAL